MSVIIFNNNSSYNPNSNLKKEIKTIKINYFSTNYNIKPINKITFILT